MMKNPETLVRLEAVSLSLITTCINVCSLQCVGHLKAVILTQQRGVDRFDDHRLVHSEFQRRHTAGT